MSAPAQRTRAHEAAVAIVVREGRASVQGRFAFTGNPGALSFEWLERACATVGPVRLESFGDAVPYARVATGPWVRLHDTSAVDPMRDSLGYHVAYDVVLRSGDVSIPIVLPNIVLTPRRAPALATVSIELPEGARVTLPRMTRVSATRWTARMTALPSAVRVEMDLPNAQCAADVTGDRGFTVVFWSLVATLVLWVPLYLWWANRQPDAG